jgi:hypothetical protein
MNCGGRISGASATGGRRCGSCRGRGAVVFNYKEQSAFSNKQRVYSIWRAFLRQREGILARFNGTIEGIAGPTKSSVVVIIAETGWRCCFDPSCETSVKGDLE